MLRARGSGRGTVALAPDFPGNKDQITSDPHQGCPRTPVETACHTPPRDVPKLGTFPLQSLLKGNTAHGRRPMQFISLAFSNWKTHWSFSKINFNKAETLCTLFSIYFKTLKSQSGQPGQEIFSSCYWAALTILVLSASAEVEHRPSQQHSTQGIGISTLLFQSCQLPAAWPQVSYFRFPNIMRSLGKNKKK